MNLAGDAAAIASRVLNKFSSQMEPEGPWQWKCVVQNGTRLQISAAFEDGFLQLACRRKTSRQSACTLERALQRNKTLTGGVKLALDAFSTGLHLRTDILVLDEKQLLSRLEWALKGFHDGNRLPNSSGAHDDRSISQTADSGVSLGDLLRETSWLCTERGPNEFSANLDANSAATAIIRMNRYAVELNLELVRSSAAAEANRLAIAVFLLTASSALRLARAFAVEADGNVTLGLQVSLFATPTSEEIEHALAALSIAHRMCARETNVLLDNAAARYYLATREIPFTDNHQPIKEN